MTEITRISQPPDDPSMIDRTTGEIHFVTGQDIRPHGLLPPQVPEESRPFHAAEWSVYPLGLWRADHGPFVAGVVVDADLRILGALLCHWVIGYRKRAVGDPERQAYHEGVILADLGGQHEFSWGRVDCRHDEVDNRNWLVVTYAPGPHVPALPPEVFGHLYARESEYDIEDPIIIDRRSNFTLERTSTAHLPVKEIQGVGQRT